MPLFSQLKYNNYIPQYVGMPLNELNAASTAIQNRYNQVREGYSLIGELADTLETSPLSTDRDVKRQLMTDVQSKIDEAAKRGDFDTMQNEMRMLAKDYAKRAQPIKENLARFQAAEKSILDSKLPQSHINYLRRNLYNTPGLSFDESGIPQYSQFQPFAENVDLRDVYEKYINDYKSDKAPNGIRKVMDPKTGLVEYYAIGSNERVDPNEVLQGLQLIALQDPKVQSFVLQDAAANGIDIKSNEDLLRYSQPLMAAYAEKAGFNKDDLQFRVGEAGRARAKAAEDKLTGGLTFDALFGQPAREGTANPSDLRNTRQSLDQNWEAKQDEYGAWLKKTGVDTLTGIGKDGKNYKEELYLYNKQLDDIDAQRWELDKIESQAKIDAGLPANWQPPKEIFDKAEQARVAAEDYYNNLSLQYNGKSLDPAERRQKGLEAYNKVIDNSGDANSKAYRTALAKNAQSRTEVKGMTTFGKNATEALERIGDSILAGESGTVAAYDVATGAPITNLEDYGDVVKNPTWTVDNGGNVVLVYQTGTMDKNQFIPSNKRIKIQAPPELISQLVDKGALDPVDLEVMSNVPKGRMKIAGEYVQIHLKRPAETGSAEVVLEFENGKREAYMSTGDAVKRLSRLIKASNGNR